MKNICLYVILLLILSCGSNSDEEFKNYVYKGIEAAKQEKSELAIDFFSKALEIKQEPNAYFNRGSQYLSRKEYVKAEKDLTKAVSINPKFTLAYYSRGTVNHFLGEIDKAILDYTKTIELKPDFKEAYYNRGLDYYSQQKLNEACQDFNAALELGYEAAAQDLEDKCKLKN